MRRKDREIIDTEAMERILDAAAVCRLGMADNNGPYVVPLCYAYENGSFYLHSAREGEKIDILRKNPQVCVEVDITDGPIPKENPCAWEMRYKSVICRGTAVFVEDSEEKKQALGKITRHYGAGYLTFPDEAVARVCIIRIDVDCMTGKQHG